MRGRRPKLQKLKIMDGNPGRRRPKKNPAPPPGAPRCPAWLDRGAKAEWKRVVPELVKAGTVARTDLAVLAAYCSAWSRYKDAVTLLRREGLTLLVEGVARRHPAVGIATDAEKQLRLLAGELGLTQLSRQRMDVSPPVKADEFEEFVRGQAGG